MFEKRFIGVYCNRLYDLGQGWTIVLACRPHRGHGC